MPKRKKSKKRSRAMPSLIIMTLTPGEKKKAMDSIKDKGKVGFEIEDVESPSIPVLRARNHPVQL